MLGRGKKSSLPVTPSTWRTPAPVPEDGVWKWPLCPARCGHSLEVAQIFPPPQPHGYLEQGGKPMLLLPVAKAVSSKRERSWEGGSCLERRQRMRTRARWRGAHNRQRWRQRSSPKRCPWLRVFSLVAFPVCGFSGEYELRVVQAVPRGSTRFPPGPGLEAGAVSLLLQPPGAWWDTGTSWCRAAEGVSAPCAAYLGKARGSLATALHSSRYLGPERGSLLPSGICVGSWNY